MENEKVVFRQFALPVSTFDYFKEYQRKFEAKQEVIVTNSQMLAVMLWHHQQLIPDALLRIKVKNPLHKVERMVYEHD